MLPLILSSIYAHLNKQKCALPYAYMHLAAYILRAEENILFQLMYLGKGSYLYIDFKSKENSH